MEAIDNKIVLEVQNLPGELKKKVLAYIRNLRKTEKKKTSKKGYGEADYLLKYIPPNLEKISVAEDFEEYS